MTLATLMTTGVAAKVCGVSAPTVNRWVDDGLLKGFRIPGSKHRRVVRADLERLAAEQGIPLDWRRAG